VLSYQGANVSKARSHSLPFLPTTRLPDRHSLAHVVTSAITAKVVPLDWKTQRLPEGKTGTQIEVQMCLSTGGPGCDVSLITAISMTHAQHCRSAGMSFLSYIYIIRTCQMNGYSGVAQRAAYTTPYDNAAFGDVMWDGV